MKALGSLPNHYIELSTDTQKIDQELKVPSRSACARSYVIMAVPDFVIWVVGVQDFKTGGRWFDPRFVHCSF